MSGTYDPSLVQWETCPYCGEEWEIDHNLYDDAWADQLCDCQNTEYEDY